MVETALIIPVPRVGPLIAPWRRRYDPTAAEGIPPHITVLYPFLPQVQVTEDDLGALWDIFATHDPFDVDLAHVGLFDDRVLHLRPDPDTAFRELTAAVHDQFPNTPPYQGRHEDPTPHVTVGHGIPRSQARQAARSLMLALPLTIHVHCAQLWIDTGRRWGAGATFPLGQSARVANQLASSR